MFALAGRINNTGLIEVPMGTSLREILFDIGGGVPAGGEFKAAQTGGPSGGCIPAEHLDTPVDYQSLQKIGSIMGSGGLIVMDSTSCMVDVARYFMEFCMDESCGKCIPCRAGTVQMHEILQRITQGKATEEDLDMLQQLAGLLREASLCGLGQTAPNPVMSTLRYFREEYDAHIKEGRCPAGTASSRAGRRAGNERQNTPNRRQAGYRPGGDHDFQRGMGKRDSYPPDVPTWAGSPTSAPAGCAWSKSKASGNCRRPA